MEFLSDSQLQNILSYADDDPEKMRQLCDTISTGIIRLTNVALAYVEQLTAHINVPVRIPMWTTTMTGRQWVDELLNGHLVRCFNALRMNKDTFLLLCHVLEYKYMVTPNSYISVLERVAWFLRTLSHRCANRDSMERFKRSEDTISKHFGDVLEAVDRLGKDYVKPRDRSFSTTPLQITKSSMYFPIFKDCVGALDGCHVELTIPEPDRMRFINRKGVTSTNVLAVCDFDMLFIFVCAGWEGSAHDTRVYLNYVNDVSQRFPKPPEGNYFLGDKGYPDRHGLMTPHMRVRYHLGEFRAEDAVGGKEQFNKRHSSLRSVIERAFGVPKARFQILRKVPSYPLLKQMKIVNACFALHNFIKISHHGDPTFALVDSSPSFIPEVVDVHGSSANHEANGSQGLQDYGGRAMVQMKETLTTEMMAVMKLCVVYLFG